MNGYSHMNRVTIQKPELFIIKPDIYIEIWKDYYKLDHVGAGKIWFLDTYYLSNIKFNGVRFGISIIN